MDPVALLKGLVSLRRLTGLYPAGHPAIEQKLTELDDSVQRHIQASSYGLRLDVIHGSAHLDGVPFRQDSEAQAQILRELTDLGVDSIHIAAGVTRGELLALSEFLWQLKEAPSGEAIDVQLAARQIRHISLGRLVPLDTRWKAVQWPDSPTGALDPSYELSLALTERTFDDVMQGKGIDLATIRDIVHLLIQKVAASNAALGQILAVKLYENLTYCHSVNVATLSLLIGKQLGFDQNATAALAEAALLHDIGKTRIPLEILKKPSALDNRPLNFEEWEARVSQLLFVSATPGPYELHHAGGAVVEQIIRPTGLVDPPIDVRPVRGQVDDLLAEIRERAGRGERVLVTTLTKRMAEDLTQYYQELGVRVRYLHSDIETLERIQILRDLRRGEFDVLVGINLLREGLDLPEVSLVAILDADKEGFLRSGGSLIQTVGRAARNVNGRAIMYADKVTDSMRQAIGETDRRRAIQEAYNREHGITPMSIVKSIDEVMSSVYERDYVTVPTEEKEHFRTHAELEAHVSDLRSQMKAAAANLEFEKAASLRDRIKQLRGHELGLAGSRR